MKQDTDNKSLLKPAVLNLINQDIPQHHLELLNLRLKFVPINTKLPFIDIFNATELCVLSLEKENQIEIQNYFNKNLETLFPKT